MKITLIAIILIIFSNIFIRAAEGCDDSATQSGAAMIVKKMIFDINEVKRVAIEKMKIELKNSMKKGSLEEANSIKNKIEEIESTINNQKINLIFGKYICNNGWEFTIKNDGSIVDSSNNIGAFYIDKNDVVVIFHKSDYINYISLSDIYNRKNADILIKNNMGWSGKLLKVN